MFPELTFSSEDIAALANNLAAAPQWMPQFIDANMEQLGRRIAYLMRMQTRRHRYTGKLESSIVSGYDPTARRVMIGPTKKHQGGWDAGMILERGTGPIPGLPFEPIARWAAFRGLPAGPIWYKIKTKGVAAHPFLDATMARGDTQTAIANTAKRLGMNLAAQAVQMIPGQKGRMRVVTSSGMGFSGGDA